MVNQSFNTAGTLAASLDPAARASGYYRLDTPSSPRINTWKVSEDVYAWEITIDDVSGGIDCIQDYFDRSWNRGYWSSLYTMRKGNLSLLPQVDTSSPTDWTNEVGIHHDIAFDNTLAIGIGDGSSSLFKFSGSTITALTYNPPSAICSLNRLIMNNTEVLVVGLLSDPADVLTDLAATPTDGGDMHADSEPLWGAIQTGLPGGKILVYANGKIYNNLNSSSAYNTALTASHITLVENGGFAIGGLQRAGGAWRAYWYIPKVNNASGDLASSTKLGRVMWCDAEGIDLQELKFHELGGVLDAAIWQDGIVACDGTTVVWYRDRPMNLRWYENRDPAIGNTFATKPFAQIRGLVTTRQVLGVEVQGLTAAGTYKRWLEVFDPTTGRWHVGSPIGAESAGLTALRPASGYPIRSFNFDAAITAYGAATSSTFYIQSQVPPGVNPQTSLRDIIDLESSGTWFSPYWEIRGLEGWAKTVSHVIFAGDLPSGSSSGTCNVQVSFGGAISVSSGTPSYSGGQTATFSRTTTRVAQYDSRPHNQQPFSLLQVGITINRGTDEDNSPNALPIIIRGFAHKPNWMRGASQPGQHLELSYT